MCLWEGGNKGGIFSALHVHGGENLLPESESLSPSPADEAWLWFGGVGVLFFCCHLVLAALAGLQAGQDLALDDLHPGVPLLVGSGFKVPRLPRQRDDGELKVLLLFYGKENGIRARSRPPQTQSALSDRRVTTKPIKSWPELWPTANVLAAWRASLL